MYYSKETMVPDYKNASSVFVEVEVTDEMVVEVLQSALQMIKLDRLELMNRLLKGESLEEYELLDLEDDIKYEGALTKTIEYFSVQG